MNGKEKTGAVLLVLSLLCGSAVNVAIGDEEDIKRIVSEHEASQKKNLLGIMEANKDAVVMVEIAIKLSGAFRGRQMPPQERKFRLNGTVISKEGLVVISNSSADPMATLGHLKNNPEANLNAEVLKSKIVLNEGTEISAKVVLKDQDLDLAFVMPSEKQEKEFVHVKLDPTVPPDLLDVVCSVSRMDLTANRTPLIQIGRISGIIKKPRTYYVGPALGAGQAAFNTDGKCFGLFLRRQGNDGPTGSPVILPAEEVLEAAKPLLKKKEEEPEKDK